MRTDDLVSLLATGVAPVDVRANARRFGRALALGGAGALLLMICVFGVRPDLDVMLHTPIFWAKLAFPLCLAVAAWPIAKRLAHPGVAVGHWWQALAVPVAVVWAAALVVIWLAAPDARASLIMGATWRTCPFNILLLSVPAFIAVFWAMRGLAPVRPRLAGAAGGLLAASLATVAYCLHCPEMSVAFWAVWYMLGLLLASLIGALLGPRLLRW